MASLDKASVREKVDEMKSTFLQLKNEGKVSSETLALMNSLFLIVDLILSIFLEKQTRKTKQNSSLTSSQTEKDKTGKPQAGTA